MRPLIQRQIDQRILALQESARSMKGVDSWIGYFRKALGMTLSQLAARMELSYTAARELEQGEMSDRITLRSLKRAAGALNCELVYAFVPRSGLDEMRENQARAKARSILKRARLQMEMEDQAVSKKEEEKLFEELVQKIKASKKLWEPVVDGASANRGSEGDEV